MLNFGVTEVAHSKSSAPGWAYVPVNNGGSGTASHQPASRKRIRTEIGSNHHETTARQDAKVARDVAALDKENHREVSIPIPPRNRDVAGRGRVYSKCYHINVLRSPTIANQSKMTIGVRRILQSAKTFANHLADYEAHLALNGSSQVAPFVRPAPVSLASSNPAGTVKPRSHRKKDPNEPLAPTPLRKVSTAPKGTPIKSESDAKDNPVPDSTSSLSLGTSTLPPPHPRDDDPLLISKIPQLPSQEEIDALLAVPPLSYHEAKGSLTEEDRRKPVRRFCEVCGYWGRVRCTRCGGRVCALECLHVHQEECFTRYGA